MSEGSDTVTVPGEEPEPILSTLQGESSNQSDTMLQKSSKNVAGHLVSRRLVQTADHGHSRIVDCSDV